MKVNTRVVVCKICKWEIKAIRSVWLFKSPRYIDNESSPRRIDGLVGVVTVVKIIHDLRPASNICGQRMNLQRTCMQPILKNRRSRA